MDCSRNPSHLSYVPLQARTFVFAAEDISSIKDIALEIDNPSEQQRNRRFLLHFRRCGRGDTQGGRLGSQRPLGTPSLLPFLDGTRKEGRRQAHSQQKPPCQFETHATQKQKNSHRSFLWLFIFLPVGGELTCQHLCLDNAGQRADFLQKLLKGDLQFLGLGRDGHDGAAVGGDDGVDGLNVGLMLGKDHQQRA